MEPEALKALAAAAAKLKREPKLVHHPELGLFRDYLSDVWGIRLDNSGIPVPKAPLQIDLSDDEEEAAANGGGEGGGGAKGDEPETVVQAFDVADSDDEEDPDRIPEDSGPYPPLPPARAKGQEAAALSDSQLDACAAAKQAAQEALEAGNVDLALEKFTEALLTGAASALLFVRRAELLMKLRRPVAAVRDCDAAIEVNADSGKAHRIRGLAYRALGRWETAHRDLVIGQKLDYEESLLDVSKFVAEKARRVEERRAALSAPARKRRRGGSEDASKQ